MLFKFGKWIDYGKSHPKGKKFPPKGEWSGSRDHFWNEDTLFKFRKCIDYMASATPGVKNPPPQKVWCSSSDRFLNFNHFNISGGMRWGQWGKADGVQVTMLCRIPSLFLNDAWISMRYSDMA